MKERKVILFKIKGEVVVEEKRELLLTEIEEMKWVIVYECECNFDDIDVEFETTHSNKELSEYDVTCTGIVAWKDPYFKTITGVTLKGDIDDLLDSIGKKYMDKYLELS